MRHRAIFGVSLLATMAASVADDSLIEAGKPFPLVPLPVVGGDDGFDSLESYRGRKVMLHLFASW